MTNLARELPEPDKLDMIWFENILLTSERSRNVANVD